MTGKYISLIEASKLCSYSQGYLSLRARQGKLKAVKLGRNWVTTQEWLREYIEETKGQIKGEEKKFIPDISLQEAAKLCSYSQEYLSLRARQGKLKAVKLGRNWVTTQEWLREYTGQVKDKDEEEKFIPEVKPEAPVAPVLIKEIKKPISSYIQKVISPFVQKLCQPKFILSSALIILLLISSIFFFSPQARTSLINTGEGIANFVFSQKQNITNLPYYLSNMPERISQAVQEAPASLVESLSQFNQKLSQKIIAIPQSIKSKLGQAYIKLAEFFIPGYSLEPSFLRMPEQLLPGQRNIIKVKMPVIQEIVEQVQEITPQIVTKEVTKELTKEVSQVTQVTKTIQSADLAQLNQDISLLSQRITNLGSQISSKIDYTVPSYAPVYVPSSGLQVSGHALLTTLNVTGSGALGGSLSVADNASFGNTKDQNTTFDVYSDATFHEPVSANAGLSISGGNLTVGGDGTISGALSAATTTVIGDFTVQDSDGIATLYVDSSGQRVGIGATSPDVLLTVGSSTPNQIAQANRYNSAFVSGDLEVDGTVYFTGGSTFANSTVTQLTISDYLWIGDEDADNLDIRAGIWNLTSTATTTVAMAKGLNFDSGTFVIDPNSGRVGIGTTSPAHLFQIGDISANHYFSVSNLGHATSTGSLYIGGTASTTELFVQSDGHIGGNLTVDGTIDSITGIDASDLTIEATDNWTGEFNGEASSFYATSTGLALAYKTLADLQTAVSNDFHNLGGTDADTNYWTDQSGWLSVVDSDGIVVSASSTISDLHVNAFHIDSSSLVTNLNADQLDSHEGDYYLDWDNLTDRAPTSTILSLLDSDYRIAALNATSTLVDHATTTGAIYFSEYTSCNLETDADGLLVCGTDEDTNYWTDQSGWLSVVDSDGIVVSASSTISDLHVNAFHIDSSSLVTNLNADQLDSHEGDYYLDWDNLTDRAPTSTILSLLDSDYRIAALNATSTLVDHATTTGAIYFSEYTSCNLETDADGLLVCGTDEDTNYWTDQSGWLSVVDSDGIVVSASSTISDLHVNAFHIDSSSLITNLNADQLDSHEGDYYLDWDNLTDRAPTSTILSLLDSDYRIAALNATSTLVDHATTTGAIYFSEYTSCNLDTDADGLLVCGTDADTNYWTDQSGWLSVVDSDGIVVSASSTISDLHVNAFHIDSSSLVTNLNADQLDSHEGDYYLDWDNLTDRAPTSTILSLLDSDYRIAALNATSTLVDHATTTGAIYFSEYTSCNLDTDADGLLVCGTDADTNYWTDQSGWLSVVDSDGIVVSASSTISDLHVNAFHIDSSSLVTNLNADQLDSHEGDYYLDWDNLTDRAPTSTILSLLDSDYRIAALNATSTLVDHATTTGAIYFSEYTSCNLDTDADGLLVCGTDADTNYWTDQSGWLSVVDSDGIVVSASSTILTLHNDTFETDSLTVNSGGSISFPNDSITDAMVSNALTINTSLEGIFTGNLRTNLLNATSTLVDHATTTGAIYFSEYTSCNLDTDADGLLVCGTDADTNYWTDQSGWLSVVDSDGIVVSASSTISDLHVNAFHIDSSSLVTNLNADQLDSHEGDYYLDWDNLTDRAPTSTILSLLDSDYRIAALNATSTLVDHATTTGAIYFSEYTSCNLDTDADGLLVCGTDADTNYWTDQSGWLSVVDSDGIVVSASSTISDLHADSLEVTGIASSTQGFRINDYFTVDSNGHATVTGSLYAGQLSVGTDGSQYYFPAAKSGTANWILKTDASGILTWQADTGGGGSGSWTSITDAIHHNTTTDTVLIGKNTLADGSRALEVSGNSYFDGSATTTGTFYVGTDYLVVDASGNVGIGTTTPEYKLSVAGQIYATSTSDQLILVNDLVNNYYSTFSVDSNGDLTIDLATANATVTVADNFKVGGNATVTDSLYAGQLSVGTDGSQYYFPAARSGTGDYVLKTDASGILTWAAQGGAAWQWDPTHLGMTPTTTGAGIYLTGSATTTALIYTGDGSATAPSYTFTNDVDTGLFSATTNELGFTTAGTERMRIDANGYVGIGTTTPDSKLTVIGRMHASSTTEQLRLTYDVESSKYASFTIDSNGSLTVDLATNNATTTFNENLLVSTSTFYVDVGTGYFGRVGIGTTTPQTALHIGTASTSNLTTFDDSLFVSGELEVGETAYLGPLEFDTNAGIVSWIDMPVTSGASAGTVESYTARLDGTNILTVYAESDGSGGIRNPRIGINTTTPWASLSITGVQGSTTPLFTIATTTGPTGVDMATTTDYLTVLASGNIGIHDNDSDFGLELVASTTSGYFGVSSGQDQDGDLFIIDASGNIGIGTTTPDQKLTVIGMMHASTSAEQLRLTYDLADSDYASFTVDYNGDLTIDLATANATVTIADNFKVGGNATITGHFAIKGLDGSGGDLKIAADGSIYEGTDDTEGGAAWQWDAANSGMTPTTTGAGIYLTGSATTTANLYVTGTGQLATITASMINKVVVVDGVHYSQDGAGIQAAIDALPATGGKVFLPAGSYNITATITIPSFVTLEGAGATSTILRLADNADDPVLYANDAQGIRIANLKIDGNDANNTDPYCHGIYFNIVTYSQIDHVFVWDAEDYGIHLYKSATNTISDNILKGNDNGINLLSSSHNTITGNTSNDNTHEGIYLEESSNNAITGNTSNSNSWNGINLNISSNNAITGNTSNSNSWNGIRLEESSNNAITGNTSNSNSWNGIYFEGGSNNTITGNIVYDNGGNNNYDGIRLYTSDNNLISSNRIYDSEGGTHYAINITADATSDNNYIVGNETTGVWTKPINDAGIGTKYTQKERITLDTSTWEGMPDFNIFSITASSSAAILSITATSTSNILSMTASSTQTHLVYKLAGSGALMNITDNTDTSRFYIDNSGNVGLGTTTPDSKLTVIGRMHASSTTEQLRLTYDVESSKYASFTIDSNGSLTVDLATNNATTTFNENLLVSTSTFYVDVGTGYFGRVGIGTTTPQTALHIGTASTSNLTTFDDSLFVSGELEVGETAYLGPMEFDTNAGLVTWVDMPVTSAASAGTIESYIAGIDGADILTIYAESDGSGSIRNPRVGINTTTPWASLSVTGVLGSSTPLFSVATTTNAGGTSYFNIDVDGNVGIGTTTPDQKLTVIGMMHASTSAEQLRLTYDLEDSDYASFTVDSAGDLTIDLATSNATTTFSDNVVISGNLGGSSPLEVVTDLIISANATTTGSLYIGQDLTVAAAFNQSGGAAGFATTTITGDFTVQDYGGSSTHLYVQNNTGYLGLGTTTPHWDLQVADTDTYLALSDTDAGTDSKHYLFMSSGGIFKISSSSDDFVNTTDFLKIDTSGELTLGSGLTDVFTVDTDNTVNIGDGGESMRIDSNGNVGINTTTPWALLSVGGSAGGTTNLFAISTSTAAYATSTAFIVTSQGKVGIGTTTPTYALNVEGDILYTGNLHGADIIFANNFVLTEATTTADKDTMVWKNPSGQTLWAVDEAGQVGIGSTSPGYLLSMESGTGGGYYSIVDHQWHNGSSRAIKQDITPIASAEREELLDLLNNLEINKFRFITDVEEYGDEAIWQYGIIADDSPELLTGHHQNSIAGGSAIQFLLSVNQTMLDKVQTLEDALYVDELGNVAIGTTTSTSTTTARLTIQGTGLTASTTAFSVINASSASLLHLVDNGHVGIGTTSPTNILTIGQGKGNALADGWDVYSSEEYKTDITYLEEQDYDDILEEIGELEVATYKWKETEDTESTTDSELNLGLIAENAPEQILGQDGQSISLYDFASYNLAGIKALDKEVEEIKNLLNLVLSEEEGEPVIVEDSQLNVDEDGYVTLEKLKVDQLEIAAGGQLTMPEGPDEIIGLGLIGTSSDFAIIENNKIATSSKIFVSFNSNLAGNSWWICDRAVGQSFKLCLDQEAEEALSFDYWIIGTQQATSTEIKETTEPEAEPEIVEVPEVVVEEPVPAVEEPVKESVEEPVIEEVVVEEEIIPVIEEETVVVEEQPTEEIKVDQIIN